MFYAATAVLYERGITSRKHSGLRAAFHQSLVKCGLLGEEWGRLYDRLFEDRQEGDYIAFSSFERDYLEEQPAKTKELLAAMKPLLGTLAGGP